MNLDITQPVQKSLLDKALLKLESDDLWSETNPIEQTYKEEGLKRYHFEKFLGNLMDVTVKEQTDVKVTKDCLKKLKSTPELLLPGCNATGSTVAEAQAAVPVKLEHVWILPAKTQKGELGQHLGKIKGLVVLYKKFRVQFGGSEKEDKIKECLSLLEEAESEVLAATLQEVEELSESSCKAFVERNQVLLAKAGAVKEAAEEFKKQLNADLKSEGSLKAKPNA